MRKIYRKKDIVINVDNNEQVNFEVRFVSDGNSGVTAINIPGDNDPDINNTGIADLGKGIALKETDKTVIVSDITNLAQEETDIIIDYLCNGSLVYRHHNEKTESDRPLIILWIKFK